MICARPPRPDPRCSFLEAIIGESWEAMADDPNGWKLFQSFAAYQPDPVQSTAPPDSNTGLVGTSYCVVIESFPEAAAELHQQLEGSFPQATIPSIFQRDQPSMPHHHSATCSATPASCLQAAPAPVRPW
jgi:hypothetical protein